jgi:hypothetical protein
MVIATLAEVAQEIGSAIVPYLDVSYVYIQNSILIRMGNQKYIALYRNIAK